MWITRPAAAALLVVMTGVPALAQPIEIATLGRAPLMGQSTNAAELQYNFKHNEGLMRQAGMDLGLTNEQYEQFRLALEVGKPNWVVVPRHLDAMTWASGGQVHVLRDVIIPANQKGVEVDLHSGDKIISLFLPAKCGNLSVIRRAVPHVAAIRNFPVPHVAAVAVPQPCGPGMVGTAYPDCRQIAVRPGRGARPDRRRRRRRPAAADPGAPRVQPAPARRGPAVLDPRRRRRWYDHPEFGNGSRAATLPLRPTDRPNKTHERIREVSMNRRNFISAAAATIAAAGAAGATSGVALASDGVVSYEAFLATARAPFRHKQLFTSPRANNGAIFAFMRNSLNGYQFGWGEGPGTLHAAAVLNGLGVAQGLDDEMWARYAPAQVLVRNNDVVKAAGRRPAATRGCTPPQPIRATTAIRARRTTRMRRSRPCSGAVRRSTSATTRCASWRSRRSKRARRTAATPMRCTPSSAATWSRAASWCPPA